MAGNDIEPFEIKGNLAVIAHPTEPNEFGDGSIDVDGNLNINGGVRENTIGNGITIENVKSISVKTVENTPNTPLSESVLYIQGGKLKSIDLGGVITIYQPTTLQGDLITHSGTTQTRLPIGSEGQVLKSINNLPVWREQINEVILAQDSKPMGTDAGTSSITWKTRDLTELTGNSQRMSIDPITSEFTLQPGKYLLNASSPSFRSNDHRIRLFNVSEDTVSGYGVAGNSQAGENPAEVAEEVAETATMVAQQVADAAALNRQQAVDVAAQVAETAVIVAQGVSDQAAAVALVVSNVALNAFNDAIETAADVAALASSVLAQSELDANAAEKKEAKKIRKEAAKLATTVAAAAAAQAALVASQVRAAAALAAAQVPIVAAQAAAAAANTQAAAVASAAEVVAQAAVVAASETAKAALAAAAAAVLVTEAAANAAQIAAEIAVKDISLSNIIIYLEISQETVYAIQHISSRVKEDNGLGRAIGAGPEIYTVLLIHVLDGDAATATTAATAATGTIATGDSDSDSDGSGGSGGDSGGSGGEDGEDGGEDEDDE